MAQTLRVLARQRHAQPHVRIRQRDHRAMHVRHLASDPGPGHAEIDLHAARRPLEPHVPLAIRHAAVRLAPPVHVTHRGRILAVVIRLRQQTVVHAPDRVPLLPGQQTIGLQPLVHQMRVRVDLRPVPAIRLRLGRAILHIRVLRDRPAIHMQTTRYLRARHSPPVESPDILHNGHRYRHVPFPFPEPARPGGKPGRNQKPIGHSEYDRPRHRCLSHHRETMTTPGKTISPHYGKTLPNLSNKH